MQHMESVQMVKEQLRQKIKELKKQEKEKEKLNEKINNILKLNQKKITELKSIIDQKDVTIKEQEQMVWAAKAAKHVALEKAAEGKAEEAHETATATAVAPEAGPPDHELLEQMERLKARDKELREMLSTRQKETQKLDREKTVLLKELKRMREEAQETEKLKLTIEQMKTEAKQMSGHTHGSVRDLENLIREKDQVIESYEKMLYGNVAPGMEGMLPSEIIVELQEELENLERERKDMIMELETLREQNEQLEMKVAIQGEKSGKSGDTGAGFRSLETEVQATEFHLGLEKFLISYADLITLLLVMFIFLYSISKIDDTLLAEALSSIQAKEAHITSTNIRLTMGELRMLERVRELVKDNVDPESLVRSDTRTIIIRLNTSDLFAPGSAELIDGADQVIISAVKEEAQEGVKQLVVEGHTDDVPIKTEQFQSNWELSTARAAKVARFFIERLRFSPNRLVVAGYGEYRPLEPNDSDDHRALNRRVEIKILKDKAVATEEAAKTAPGAAPGTAPKPAEQKPPGKAAPPEASKK
ncbi:MAG: OmpA family protein [Nitrospinae bacterium]|nr:OmpA family protein [Nitrospinota bacterium]